MVEDWLAPDPSTKVRVAEFSNRRARRQCYVRIEVSHDAGPMETFFFRHTDGSWRIFPQERERPCMRADALA
jgi:hypothetical protein